MPQTLAPTPGTYAPIDTRSAGANLVTRTNIVVDGQAPDMRQYERECLNHRGTVATFVGQAGKHSYTPGA